MEELIKRAASDLRSCTYGIALSGAGISTESGLADFRGPRGIWKTDPQAEAKAYQRYETFLSDPRSYWEEMLGTVGTGSHYYEQIRQAGPNPGHFAMSKLEQTGIIKCIITQNIDGLHERAGSS